MLQRSSQIGEFYRMSPPEVFNMQEKLPSSYMDIMIYDEESDRHVHITFEAALNASCYGQDAGPNRKADDTHSDLFGIMNFDDNSPAGKKYTAHVDAYTKGVTAGKYEGLPGADDAANGVAKLGDKKLSKIKEAYEALVTAGRKDGAALYAVAFAKTCARYGIWCPVEVVVARPFIEHLMLSAVVTVAGRDTGATLFGPADM
jgi:hypothetical protein